MSRTGYHKRASHHERGFQAKHNARRRERYATDMAYRAATLAHSRLWKARERARRRATA